MPANHKVSVAWQIVFTFISILNLWAFYRIRKLRKYVAYVIVPDIAILIGWLAYLSYYGAWWSPEPFLDPLTINFGPLYIIVTIASWALQGLAIYLVIIWSRHHNKQFDQPST